MPNRIIWLRVCWFIQSLGQLALLNACCMLCKLNRTCDKHVIYSWSRHIKSHLLASQVVLSFIRTVHFKCVNILVSILPTCAIPFPLLPPPFFLSLDYFTYDDDLMLIHFPVNHTVSFFSNFIHLYPSICWQHLGWFHAVAIVNSAAARMCRCLCGVLTWVLVNIRAGQSCVR